MRERQFGRTITTITKLSKKGSTQLCDPLSLMEGQSLLSLLRKWTSAGSGSEQQPNFSGQSGEGNPQVVVPAIPPLRPSAWQTAWQPSFSQHAASEGSVPGATPWQTPQDQTRRQVTTRVPQHSAQTPSQTLLMFLSLSYPTMDQDTPGNSCTKHTHPSLPEPRCKDFYLSPS